MAVIAQRLNDLVARLDQLTNSLEQGYVRKDVYAADRAGEAIKTVSVDDELHAVGKRIDRIEERLSAHFRLLLAGLVYPLLVSILGYLIYASVHH
jgi:hypothetical protein